MYFSKTLVVLGTLVAALAVTLAPIGASAQAKAFRVRNDGGSRVQFTSDAPLETINGVTSNVSGEVQIDPANLATVTGRVQVQTSSLRTGVDLRDEHLAAENWLDAARYPNITFEVTRISGATSLTPNQAAEVQIHGRLTLHGVTRDVVARGRMEYIPLTEAVRGPGIDGDVIRVRARFTVRLPDFNVSVPTIVRLKVSDEIEVGVSIRAIAAPAS